ncbi:unnamed protein product [Arabidopsis lyrata]|nr:unnamed protein product [Arabidopsis lyrata]
MTLIENTLSSICNFSNDIISGKIRTNITSKRLTHLRINRSRFNIYARFRNRHRNHQSLLHLLLRATTLDIFGSSPSTTLFLLTGFSSTAIDDAFRFAAALVILPQF